MPGVNLIFGSIRFGLIELNQLNYRDKVVFFVLCVVNFSMYTFAIAHDIVAFLWRNSKFLISISGGG
jgi:hypothetical protein